MSAQQIAYEDKLAGRSIPAWKYDTGIFVVVFAVFGGRALPDGLWWTLGIYTVAFVLYALLLGPYRRRAIR